MKEKTVCEITYWITVASAIALYCAFNGGGALFILMAVAIGLAKLWMDTQ